MNSNRRYLRGEHENRFLTQTETYRLPAGLVNFNFGSTPFQSSQLGMNQSYFPRISHHHHVHHHLPREADHFNNQRRRSKLTYSRWNMMISSRYKTELCRQFGEEGVCQFDEKCLFAHGQDEMRPLARHPKYKTELCRDFHETGFCSFGPRCNFIHSASESQVGNKINKRPLLVDVEALAQLGLSAEEPERSPSEAETEDLRKSDSSFEGLDGSLSVGGMYGAIGQATESQKDVSSDSGSDQMDLNRRMSVFRHFDF